MVYWQDTNPDDISDIVFCCADCDGMYQRMFADGGRVGESCVSGVPCRVSVVPLTETALFVFINTGKQWLLCKTLLIYSRDYSDTI